MELSGSFSVQRICHIMEINRSGFYKWKARMTCPSSNAITRAANMKLFKEYHEKYPSHGYRWLNAKIRLDTGQVMSDNYAHKCCKAAGIRSKAKRMKYRRPGKPYRVYPNLMAAGVQVDGPLQCVVSDMTAFRYDNIYYELTLYVDVWNNEILSYGLSRRKGDRNTYISGLNDLITIKDQFPELEMVLHTDQGAVYASKSFNEILPMHGILRSMSRAGTPTDNATIESINGWIKAEIFTDMHLKGEKPIENEIEDYIRFFNEERPAYSLGYLTPKQYREITNGM